jgi:hypothetical protein
MQVMPNILTELLSGKLGEEYVFAASKGDGPSYIQSCRRYTKPLNPNTPDQQITRTAFAQAVLFWKSATDKTIGATSFVRTDFNESVRTIAASMSYYGIPLIGVNAGRQTFIAAAVAYQGSVPNAFAVLPQNITTEQDLEDLNQDITSALNAIVTKLQDFKIGHIGQPTA